MIQYQDLLKVVLQTGVERTNRTNQKDRFIPSAMMAFDLRKGFPAVTTKQLFYKQAIGEILGFIRGYESATEFRALGCNIWNSDANENKQWLSSPYRKGEDDLGKIYGSTWRNREVTKIALAGEEHDYLLDEGYSYVSTLFNKTHGSKFRHSVLTKSFDQLKEVISTILNTPNNRRIIMHAWFPELFAEMALPPCHCLYRFIPDEKNKVLHMGMYQRSCDLLLGVPFNIFGSSLLLALVSKATGYTAGVFTHHLDDVHLYDNQVEAAQIQISREPLELPNLNIHNPWNLKQENGNKTDQAIYWLEQLEPKNIILENYSHHKKLPKVEMAQEK